MSQESPQLHLPLASTHVLDPSNPDVIGALYDFALGSSEITAVVFESSASARPNADISDDSDSYPYGTNKGNIISSLAEGRMIGSIAFVSLNGSVEIIPPLKDQEKQAHIERALLETAEKARTGTSA